jgi:hypothetical protein
VGHAHYTGETDNDEIDENISTATETNTTREYLYNADPFDTDPFAFDSKAKPQTFTTKHYCRSNPACNHLQSIEMDARNIENGNFNRRKLTAILIAQGIRLDASRS